MEKHIGLPLFLLVSASCIALAFTCGNPAVNCNVGEDQTSLECSVVEEMVTCLVRESKGCTEDIKSQADEIISSAKEQYPGCNYSHGLRMRAVPYLTLLAPLVFIITIFL